MLTLVSKQDLWWPQRQEVEKHYREGPYRTELQKLVELVNARQFRHETAFASLVINNFTSGIDEHHPERLCPNAEGYDHPLQIQSLRHLFEVVDALKNWEADP